MKEGDIAAAVVSENREVTGSGGQVRGERGLFLHGCRGRGEVWGQKQWVALFRGGQMKFCLLSEASHQLW